MDRLFGVPVKLIDWLPEDIMGAVGAKRPIPSNWNQMTAEEQIAWTITHGGTLVMSNKRWDKLKEEVQKYDGR